ncbi:MAG: hypothetical protein H0T53_01320 [Herpetosiphonaceae bacterium]|nr:hypothetical protein [Herpetosiphonaceae bacterium]
MTTVLIAPPGITEHIHADIVAEDVLTATRQVHAMLIRSAEPPIRLAVGPVAQPVEA